MTIFVRRPTSVSAFQFQGWRSVEEIFKVLSVLYVPVGAPHTLRRTNEYTSTEGPDVVKTDAPEFLVLKKNSTELRVDLNQWIVIDNIFGTAVMRTVDFDKYFEAIVKTEGS